MRGDRLALDERLDLLPLLPGPRVRVEDLEVLLRGRVEDREVAEIEGLARRPVARPDHLAGLPRRVSGVDDRADRRRRDLVDLRRVRVARRGRGARAGLGVEAAADPVAAMAGDRDGRVPVRELDRHLPGAVVEAAGEILDDLGLEPAALLLGDRDLPAKRRILGVDTGAAGLRAVDVDLEQHVRERDVEGDVERVAGLRRGAERGLVRALRLCDAARDADVLHRAAALHRVGGRPGGRDREVLDRLEDHGLFVRGADRPDLGLARRDVDRLGRRRREPEAQPGGGRDRRLQLDPEQVEQRHVQLLGHPVQPVDDRLGQPREQLDQRDPWVGDVVLGPLRAALREPQARLVDEVLEVPVVERDFGDTAGHRYSGSEGMR